MSQASHRHLVASSWAVAIAALPAVALAVSPTAGVLMPAGSVAGDADATAVELNPGQVGLADGPGSALVIDHWDRSVARPGRGAALLLNAPLFAGSSLGLGWHWLRPTVFGQPGAYSKSQLAFGQRLTRGLGVGVSWDHVFGSRYAGLDSYALGLGWRPHSFVALGAAVHDVGRPVTVDSNVALPRRWDVDLALRWPGTDVVELGLGAHITAATVEAPQVVAPHIRFSARLMRGLRVFGTFERARSDVEMRVGYQTAVGLAVDLDHLGLSVTGLGGWSQYDSGVPTTSDGSGPGSSFVLRTSHTRRPALVSSSYVARVTLSEIEDDRAFVDLIVRLRRLAEDRSVAGVLLKLDGLELGMGRVEEVRELIAHIRRTKPVFAFLSGPSTREYYLASACTGIALHPAGGLLLGGLSQTVTFYKGAMDKVGVDLQLVRIAEYKGAMEPFVMTENTEPVRQNREALLDDDFGRLVAAIARDRKQQGLTESGVRTLIDRGLFTPPEAKAAHLTDAVTDDDEIETFIGQAMGRKLPVREADNAPFAPRSWRPGRVAVILVDGAIMDGKVPTSPFGATGMSWSDSIIESLEQAQRDSSVKAIVLRVNSPGGSAFGSDRIARAVAKVRKAGKPVVVSMGDFAASGGYYIAAPADEIYATPSTLTGSIGIFTYKADINGLMEKVGLSEETSKRGEHADRFSLFRPWTDEEVRQASDQIHSMYQLFLDTVAQGRSRRGITAARADELGRGHVWTGAQAMGNGLVDRLGGLADAVEDAAGRGHVQLGPGGLPEMVVLPPPAPAGLRALAGVSAEALLSPAPTTPPRLPSYGRAAARLLAPLLFGRGTGIEARLPYDLEIR